VSKLKLLNQYVFVIAVSISDRTPRCRWNTTYDGVKHQSTNLLVMLLCI